MAVLTKETRRGLLGCRLALGIFVAVAGTWLWFGVQNVRVAARLASCEGQNKMFMAGMLGYHELKGRFPPACTVDRQGQPPRSWRSRVVADAILRTALRVYRPDEPWNGPHNRQLAGGLPIGMSDIAEYRCGADRTSDELRHQLRDGCRAACNLLRSRLKKPRGDSQEDRAHRCHRRNVRLRNPLDGAADLNFDAMSFKINDKQGVGIRSGHPGVAVVGMADGSARALAKIQIPKC